MELTGEVRYEPDGPLDAVPWRYVVRDEAGEKLAGGWVATREKAYERAQAAAMAIRAGVLAEQTSETFAL